MIEYGEEILKQRLWSWLETDRGMTVEGEVDIGTGRIDLIARASENEVWGIELKRGGFSSYEQVNRYLASDSFDRLYVASDSTQKIVRALQNQPPINPSTLNQTASKLRAGVEEGRYSLSRVMEVVDDEVDTTMLSREFGGCDSLRQYIKKKVGAKFSGSKDSVSLEAGIQLIKRARFPTEIGVIQVPIGLRNGEFRDVEEFLSPNLSHEPRILHEADNLDRDSDPTVARREEPWVRHCLWRKFGGLPEGHIPNVMDSDQPYRPLDLIAFEGSYDPTDAVMSPESNQVLGFEAKGESSFGRSSVEQQLVEFLETSSLSRLYLAVPVSVANQASNLLSENEDLSKTGLLTVDRNGAVETIIEAQSMQPKHDGYMNRFAKDKIGFGPTAIPGGKDVHSPYVTDEAADRLKNEDPEAYARELLTDNSELANKSGWITTNPPAEIRLPESDFDSINEARYGFSDTIRSYLLRGKSADPYGSHGEEPIPKEGYVRLRIEELERNEATSLKFHFGRGSTEGGYIWFRGEQVDTLLSVLISLDTIRGGTVYGQGKFIDLNAFPFDKDKDASHELTGKYGGEEILSLNITSVDPDEAPEGHVLPPCHEKSTAFPYVNSNTRVRFELGDESYQGVNVTLTESQLFDLIATIDILQTGNQLQLPGKHRSNPRIGPSGKNTWSLGTEIEREDSPDSPAGWGK